MGRYFQEPLFLILQEQPHQRLPGLHALAFLDHHRQRHARGLGDHLRFGACFQCSGAGIAGGNRAVRGLGHLDRHRVAGGRGGARRFADDPAWGERFALNTALALGRQVIRVDVAADAIEY